MSVKLPTFSWDKAISSIKNSECVLFLGPELLRYKGKAVTRYMCEHLYRSADDGDIDAYYEEDAMFLFSGRTAKIQAKRNSVKFLQEIWEDAEFISENDRLLKMLSELPLHLIVTLTPDKFISGTLAKYGIEHQTGYFIGGNKPIPNVSAPNSDNPLIYNLYGSIDNHESIILDYLDLYTYMKSVLDYSRMPNPLISAIKEATIFIFIGFEMEKWDTQMLLQLLQEIINEPPEKYSTEKPFKNSNFEGFFRAQFKIAPVKEQVTFLHELHQNFIEKNPNALRKTKLKSSAGLAVIQQYISENDFVNALNELEKHVQSNEDRIILTVLKSDRLNYEKHKDLEFPENREILRRQLVHRILSIAQQIIGVS